MSFFFKSYAEFASALSDLALLTARQIVIKGLQYTSVKQYSFGFEEWSRRQVIFHTCNTSLTLAIEGF